MPVCLQTNQCMQAPSLPIWTADKGGLPVIPSCFALGPKGFGTKRKHQQQEYPESRNERFKPLQGTVKERNGCWQEGETAKLGTLSEKYRGLKKIRTQHCNKNCRLCH